MGPVAKPVIAPEPAEVVRIRAISDPILRNLEITHCYHRLSAAMSARTGACANWCTFATWASRQAGCSIRGEDLIDQFQRKLRDGSALLHPVRALWRVLLRRGLLSPQTRLGRVVRAIHSPFDAFELTSDAISRGNLKVFAEIGYEFARYLSTCPPEAPQIDEFLAGLRPGEPPDGQGLLRAAFTRYHRQRSEGNDQRRAQMIFLANLEIAFHEQIRLQPEIQEALNAPILAKGEPPSWRGLTAPLRRFSMELTRAVITECLMTLALPGAVLALSRHLDAPAIALLRDVDDAELAELLARLEPSAGPDDCGAKDWSALEERMHYVAHLFRAYHDREELLGPPFTPEQVTRFGGGVIPDGEL
jgi:hypothetical protein